MTKVCQACGYEYRGKKCPKCTKVAKMFDPMRSSHPDLVWNPFKGD